MNIEELHSKHFNIPNQAYQGSSKHTNISIEFAIELLEKIADDESEHDTIDLVWFELEILREFLKDQSK
jgi:hypothetical protein